MARTATLFSTCILGVWTASAAHAGVVYGTMTHQDSPLAEVPIHIGCESDSYDGETDDKGSYSIDVKETGRCDLQIEYRDQEVEAFVYSGRRPARHDFELVREGDSWKLRRK